MARRTIKRYLAMCLAVVMLLTVLPVGVYAADGAPFEDGAAREDLAASGSMDLSVEPEEAEPDVQPRLEPMEDAAAITAVSDYAAFLSCLKDLEGYARSYAAENPAENVNALIINFIRTGVERYTSERKIRPLPLTSPSRTRRTRPLHRHSKTLKTSTCRTATMQTSATCSARWTLPTTPRCRA